MADGEDPRLLVEIRRYVLEPGLRDEFVEWFEEEVLPAMEEAGMRILGVFTAVDDPDVFYYLRGYDSEEERTEVTEAFYQSPVWLEGMRDKALAMERSYTVELVRSTLASSI